MTPVIGERSVCQRCGKPIEYIGPFWRHAVGGKGPEYRHHAKPKEAANATKPEGKT